VRDRLQAALEFVSRLRPPVRGDGAKFSF
jgi:hypothetical protein